MICSAESNNTTRIKVTLSIPSPMILPGDYDNNGTVDASAYVVWRRTLGQMVNLGTGADGDGNGMIEQADYGVWRTWFGQPAGSGSAVASSSDTTVPGPAGALLFCLGVVCSLLVDPGRYRQTAPTERSAQRSERACPAVSRLA
jgi:hypothetical protein